MSNKKKILTFWVAFNSKISRFMYRAAFWKKMNNENIIKILDFPQVIVKICQIIFGCLFILIKTILLWIIRVLLIKSQFEVTSPLYYVRWTWDLNQSENIHTNTFATPPFIHTQTHFQKHTLFWCNSFNMRCLFK